MKTCKECGRPFDPTGNRQEYCSKKCQREHERKKERVTEYITSRNKRAISYKANMMIVYQCKCAICGWQASPIIKKNRKGNYDLQKGCEIHHIVPVSKGGTDGWDNLIMLCPNHHKMADLGIIGADELSKHVKPKEATEEQISATFTNENVAYFRTHRSSFQNITLDEMVDRYNERYLLLQEQERS